MSQFHLKAHRMRNFPPLARLRTFEAAARLQSFALAAQELHLTASAISHQIRDLERHFGRALFERRHRQVQTTLEGRRLFESLARLFDALEAACADVQLPTQDQVLSVHCAPSLALKWLGPRLNEFLAAHPGVNIRLTTGADALDLRVVREVDVELSYGAVREMSGLLVVPLGSERIAPLVSPSLLVRRVPAARQIHQLTLIDSTLSPLTWGQWFERHGLSLPARPRPAFDRAAMAIAAAVDGMGVALESTRLAARELERGELVILGEKVFQAVVQPVHFMSVRAGDQHRPAVQAFTGWLTQTVR